MRGLSVSMISVAALLVERLASGQHLPAPADVEFEPKSTEYKVDFSLEDADLTELVRVVAQLTRKRFIFDGKLKSIRASVYSPEQVTVAEAYQAFLSILEANGLTVVPHGRFLKVVATAGVATQDTPLFGAGEAGIPPEDRYVTRLHRLSHGSAEEVAGILSHFKTKDGDITAYAPGNLLIITDTGSNIRRMMRLIEEFDLGVAGEQIWIEPIRYGSATEIAGRLEELFDVKASVGGAAGVGKASRGASADVHVSKLLADQRTNSIVIVGTGEAYRRTLEIINRLDTPQTGEGEVHVLAMQHADAAEITKILQEIVTGAGALGTPGGQPAPTRTAGAPSGIFDGGMKISADKASNSIVVTSSVRDYASLRTVIDQLDKPRKQVFIDAVVMDLNVTQQDQLGVSFHVASSSSGSLLYGGLNPLKTILLPDASSLQGLALGIRGPGIAGSENLLGTGLTIPAFGLLVSALTSDSDADVLSTPHILATDNTAAEINVGENVPLQTNSGLSSSSGSASGLSSLTPLGALGGGSAGSGSRSDVGTKIKIIPHLNDSNEVRLELTEEISEAQAAQGTLGVVPITKRNAVTQLTVRDQQTVIIGGLMRKRVTHSTDKIPVLGDIPVLGVLFRSTTTSIQKTNLLLVLTPTIIRERSDLAAVFERKLRERQEFLDRYFVFSEDSQFAPPRDYTRAHGLIEDMQQSYLAAEERKRLNDAARPESLKTHEPKEPVAFPAVPRR